MAIGLGMLRAPGRWRLAGRVGEECGPPPASTTVREVCLIGLDRRSPARDWTPGREVVWLGRTYEVQATAADPDAGTLPVPGPIGPAARRYVHLTARGGD